MTNSKNSKIMKELAEKIALDDFDKMEEQHEFSDTYMRKKKLFMEEIKRKGGQPRVKRKKNRLLIVAACLMIGIPTTAFGAVKVYNMIVQKDNYEVSVSVTNTASEQIERWYKLKVGYLPESMVEMENAPMKYSFKDNYAKGGFSFFLSRVEENTEFQTLYSKSYEEKEINGRKAVIVHRDTGNDNGMFDRQILLYFEEEGIMLESSIGVDVSDEQMIKVIENISLEPTTKEQASYIYDEALFSEADEPIETTVIPLEKGSQQLFSIGEIVPITINQINRLDDRLEYVIEKVEVFDSIKDFKQEYFSEMGLRTLSRNKAIDQKKQLIPYRRDVYKVGNGKDSIDELVESQFVKPKFIYLTTTVKNVGEQVTDDIYMNPSIRVLKSENNTWNYAEEDGVDEKSIMMGEVDYLAPHGKGKDFYNIGSILPGQTMGITLGYFIEEDKLNSMFLDAFNYSGFGDVENMNAENRWWIDIRK